MIPWAVTGSSSGSVPSSDQDGTGTRTAVWPFGCRRRSMSSAGNRHCRPTLTAGSLPSSAMR